MRVRLNLKVAVIVSGLVCGKLQPSHLPWRFQKSVEIAQLFASNCKLRSAPIWSTELSKLHAISAFLFLIARRKMQEIIKARFFLATIKNDGFGFDHRVPVQRNCDIY